MPAKVIVTGIILVILIAFLVFSVEFFIPLSAKSDMNICCRNFMLKMEINGGVSNQMKLDLKANLDSRGFDNIKIEGTEAAKQGEELMLCVEADYIYAKLTGIFKRVNVSQHMIYKKTTTARKVVN